MLGPGLSHALCILHLCWFVTACSSDSDDPVVPPTLSGFWSGSTTENLGTVQNNIVSYALFYEDDVYILREDEAQLGSYTIEENGHNDLLLDVHPYNNPDAVNFFFVGTYNNIKLQLDALLATDLDLVINYSTSTRAGSMDLVRDVDQQLELSFERTEGNWETTNATMSIEASGGFNGWNSSTSCQWEGTMSRLTNNLFSLNIGRENCLEFNVPFDDTAPPNGLALIDGDGILHFIATESPRVLWMRFDPVAAAAATTP